MDRRDGSGCYVIVHVKAIGNSFVLHGKNLPYVFEEATDPSGTFFVPDFYQPSILNTKELLP